MEKYLKLIEQIGEGAFSKLYSAYDYRLNKQVALKIEKNVNKNMLLKKEFEIYNSLVNLTCIPKIYNFIPNITNEKDENRQFNCIEMELLGKNLLLFKKTFHYYNKILAYDILQQSLICIQKLHNFGYIHRDIKPSNFCLSKSDENKLLLDYKNKIFFKHDINIYLIDFGLVTKINKENENNEINNRGFIGTLTYASLSSHKREDLSKKDDLWSYFFMLLDLLNEKLPWRNYSFENEKEIIETKQKCIEEPEKYLFLTNTKNNKEIINIFNYIKNLKDENEPDYEYIYNQLSLLKNKEIQKIYYNYEINNQIINLQKNLMINPNQKLEQNINSNNNTSNQDYMIFKLNKTSNKSIPSLNSTNYSSSIYYKTNYINCISNNNNENFYQSVLKLCNNNNNQINKNNNNYIINNSLNNNKKYYNCNNNMVNLHPYKMKPKEEESQKNINTNNNISNLKTEQKGKIEKKHENDKSLIEFLIGKSINDSPKKVKNKDEKNQKNQKKIKMSLHNKRKNIKFRIVKKEK